MEIYDHTDGSYNIDISNTWRANPMSVQERIITIKLLEKINKLKKFCNDMGIYDATTMYGDEINKNIPDDAIIISGTARENQI